MREAEFRGRSSAELTGQGEADGDFYVALDGYSGCAGGVEEPFPDRFDGGVIEGREAGAADDGDVADAAVGGDGYIQKDDAFLA